MTDQEKIFVIPKTDWGLVYRKDEKFLTSSINESIEKCSKNIKKDKMANLIAKKHLK